MSEIEDILYKQNPWWRAEYKPEIIKRTSFESLFLKERIEEIITIIGSRRTGKTTLMKYLITQLLHKKVNPSNILYSLMDVPILEKTNLWELLKIYRGITGVKSNEKIYLFLDEVHLSPDWERWTKSIVDIEGKKVKMYLSGSTSTLIKTKSPALTGRHINFHLGVLSFLEYLVFRNQVAELHEQATYYPKKFEDFLNIGGFPKIVSENDLEFGQRYIKDYLEDVIYKDIGKAYKVRDLNKIKEIALFLAKHVNAQLSYNKLSNVLDLHIDTLHEYVSYIESTYFVSGIPKFSESYNEMLYSPKKYYTVDTGIVNHLSLGVDIGAQVENTIFLHLASLYDSIYYWKDVVELDFVIKKPDGVLYAVESKYKDKIEEKELKGLYNFIEDYKVRHGFVITKNLEKREEYGKAKIHYIPAWKFCLDARLENF